MSIYTVFGIFGCAVIISACWWFGTVLWMDQIGFIVSGLIHWPLYTVVAVVAYRWAWCRNRAN